MTTPHSTVINHERTKFDQAIHNFQLRLRLPSRTAEDVWADLGLVMKEFALKRAQHPDLFFLNDLQLQLICLQYFLFAAKDCEESPEVLASLHSLTEILYEGYLDEESKTLHNPLLQISEESEPPFSPDHQSEILWSWEDQFTPEAWNEIRGKYPSVTKEMIRGWCKTIKELEIRRAEIVEVGALLARVKEKDPCGPHRADLMRRLTRAWSGFKSTYQYLYASTSLGNLTFAVDETQKLLAKPRRKPLYLSELPERLRLRHKDYNLGRGKYEIKDNFLEESLDKILNDETRADAVLARHTDTINIQEIDIARAITKLPPKERLAIEKDYRGEILTATERKAKSRALPKLKPLLS